MSFHAAAIERQFINLNGIFIGQSVNSGLKDLKSKGFSISISDGSIRATSSKSFIIISCTIKNCPNNSKIDSVYFEKKQINGLDCIRTFKTNSKAFGPPQVGVVNSRDRIAVWSNINSILSLQCKNEHVEVNLYKPGNIYFGNIVWVEQGSFR